jgi:hypothetical protein
VLEKRKKEKKMLIMIKKKWLSFVSVMLHSLLTCRLWCQRYLTFLYWLWRNNTLKQGERKHFISNVIESGEP